MASRLLIKTLLRDLITQTSGSQEEMLHSQQRLDYFAFHIVHSVGAFHVSVIKKGPSNISSLCRYTIEMFEPS